MASGASGLRSVVIGAALAGVGLLTSYAVEGRQTAGRWAEKAGPDSAAAAGDHWDLPVKKTDRVAYWEGVLSGSGREKMKQWLERSGRYVPMIRRRLRARGMPEDLVYVAFAESGFSPDAYSRAQAVGLWQFMEGTGRDMGLRVGRYVDERRDPIAATDAALDFLSELHDQLGSWWLAVAAYNCGPNRVVRVLREVTGRTRGDDGAYWRIAPHLPQETQDYVPLILAEGAIAKDPARFGFTDLRYNAPLRFDSVRVPGGTRLTTVSAAAGTDSAAVRKLNPHYIQAVTPPVKASEWVVRIPLGLTRTFLANFPHLLRLQKQADARAAERARAQRLAAARRRAQARRRELALARARRRAAHRKALARRRELALVRARRRAAHRKALARRRELALVRARRRAAAHRRALARRRVRRRHRRTVAPHPSRRQVHRGRRRVSRRVIRRRLRRGP